MKDTGSKFCNVTLLLEPIVHYMPFLRIAFPRVWTPVAPYYAQCEGLSWSLIIIKSEIKGINIHLTFSTVEIFISLSTGAVGLWHTYLMSK